MVLAEANWMDLAIAIIGLLAVIIPTGIAVWKHIKAGEYKDAAEDGEKMLGAVAGTMDKIKTGSTANGSRDVVSNALKELGGTLDTLGLKGKMDAKLKELGLDDKS